MGVSKKIGSSGKGVGKYRFLMHGGGKTIGSVAGCLKRIGTQARVLQKILTHGCEKRILTHGSSHMGVKKDRFFRQGRGKG